MKTIEQAQALYMQVGEFGGERQEIIGGYEVCEAAAKLPLMSEDEFRELQESLLKHGLHEKIELNDQDKVLDGRNRLLACLACDIEPEFRYKESFLDEIDEVEVKNLRRRHLPAGVKAMTYLRLHGLPEEDAKTSAVVAPATVASAPEEATEAPVKVDAQEQPAAGKPATSEQKPAATKKTRVEAAREAGVSVRAMQQAVNVEKHAVKEIQDAVATGQISVSAGEAIATLPEEEQIEVVSNKDEAQRAKDAKEKERQIRLEDQWRTFDLTKWMAAFDRKMSKILAAVPPDLRDRCHRHGADSFGSTVRVEKETEDLLNAESIVPYVEGIISGLPKSERASSELAIANRYASVVRAKDSDSALAAIGTIIEGLSEPQKKKLDSALRKQYAPAPSADAKPSRKGRTPDVPVKPSAEKPRHTS
jgi:hypothetical protein